MSIAEISSAAEFIPVLKKNQEINKSIFLGACFGYYLRAPFQHIPLSLHTFGNRVISVLKPSVPQQKDALFITPSGIDSFDFKADPQATRQLKKNFTAMFAVLAKTPHAKHISLLYHPAKQNAQSYNPAICYANGQVTFNSDLANLTEEEAKWVFGHELSHYIHKEDWICDLSNLLGAATSIALYFNHSFLAFYLSQMAFFKGATLLRRHYEYRADQYGVNLLGNNAGAVSYFTKSMMQECLSLLKQNTQLFDTYHKLPQAEQSKMLRYIAKNYGMQYQAVHHPSSWDRYTAVQTSP